MSSEINKAEGKLPESLLLRLHINYVLFKCLEICGKYKMIKDKKNTKNILLNSEIFILTMVAKSIANILGQD